MRTLQNSLTGAVAGGISAVSFALIHNLIISDIWYSLLMLVTAGAICGFFLGWTYGLFYKEPTWTTWARYNALYVGMLVAIGILSVLVFKPVTTVSSLMAVNEPPAYLFQQAMPMTIAATIVMAVVIWGVHTRKLIHFVVVLVTCAVLVLLLGLNVSIMGLVEISSSSAYLILELVGLVLALNAVFALVFIAIQRSRFFPKAHPTELPDMKMQP